MLEDDHYVRQYLEDPIFVDAASIGSYAHRPQWIWTNLVPLSTLVATFFAVLLLFYQKMDDILVYHILVVIKKRIDFIASTEVGGMVELEFVPVSSGSLLVEMETTEFDDWQLDLGPHLTSVEARKV